jgi:hypothetical protein
MPRSTATVSYDETPDAKDAVVRVLVVLQRYIDGPDLDAKLAEAGAVAVRSSFGRDAARWVAAIEVTPEAGSDGGYALLFTAIDADARRAAALLVGRVRDTRL